MDPFQLALLAGKALDECRRRVQHAIYGHRGRTADPQYAALRVLHTGVDLLTDRQVDRLTDLFDIDVHGEAHVEVVATRGIYQGLVAAYREPDRGKACS
jgi:hypothetical protein